MLGYFDGKPDTRYAAQDLAPYFVRPRGFCEKSLCKNALRSTEDHLDFNSDDAAASSLESSLMTSEDRWQKQCPKSLEAPYLQSSPPNLTGPFARLSRHRKLGPKPLRVHAMTVRAVTHSSVLGNNGDESTYGAELAKHCNTKLDTYQAP